MVAESHPGGGPQIWSGRSVLVTGGSGFIGRHLCLRLTELGAEVTLLSRNEGLSRDERLSRTERSVGSTPHEPVSSFGMGGVHWRRTDLLEGAADGADDSNGAWRSLFEELRPDVVFHLAGLVTGTRERDAVLPMLRANTELAVRLMDAAAHVGCARFVQAGSLEEPDDLDSAPASPYAASKLAASAYARLFAAHYGLSTAVARIFMVYGPGPQDEKKLVPYVIRRLLAGEPLELSAGTRPVDWVFVDDVAQGLIALAGSGAAVAELGSGELHTVRDVVERIAAQFGYRGDLPFGSRADRDQERVRRADVEGNAIPWRPSTDLDQGLRRTIDWFRG